MDAWSRGGVKPRYALRKVVRSDRFAAVPAPDTPRIAGSPRPGACDTIRYMKSQRYKWDDETKDDTPSEFASTTYSTLSGTAHSSWPQERRRRRRAARRGGVLWTMFAVVSASAAVLYVAAQWLRQ